MDSIVTKEKPAEETRWPPGLWDWKSGLAIVALFVLIYGAASVVAAALQIGAAGGLQSFIEGTQAEQTIPFSASVVALLGNILAGAVSVLLVGAGIKNYSLERIGFRPMERRWLYIALALSVGLGVVRGGLAAALQALFPEFSSIGVELLEQGLINRDNLFNAALLVLLGGLIVPVAEELFFRGFVYDWIRNGTTMWPAIIVSAAIFGAVHFVPLQVVLAFVMGIGLAWIYEKSGTLWAPIVLHLSNNVVFLLLAYLIE
jgi:hypothetical protein